MFKKLEESIGNVLGFKLSGEFTEDELEEMSREIDLTIADVEKIHLLFEFEDLEKNPEVLTIAGDHSFGSRFHRNIERMACVANDKWKRWWEKFTAIFITTEARFFTPSQRNEAINWLRQEGSYKG